MLLHPMKFRPLINNSLNASIIKRAVSRDSTMGVLQLFEIFVVVDPVIIRGILHGNTGAKSAMPKGAMTQVYGTLLQL